MVEVRRIETVLGEGMQTLSMIALIAAALAVAAFDLRELYIGLYSQTIPRLTSMHYAVFGVQLVLCVLIAIVTSTRFFIRT